MEAAIVVGFIVFFIALCVWWNLRSVNRPMGVYNPPGPLRRGLPLHLRTDVSHQRRAAEYGVPFETIPLVMVFNRDRWTCGVCQGQIDPDLVYPHPLMPSLDHVIPLSRPGSPGHVFENVQATHLRCNLVKGVR